MTGSETAVAPILQAVMPLLVPRHHERHRECGVIDDRVQVNHEGTPGGSPDLSVDLTGFLLSVRPEAH